MTTAPASSPLPSGSAKTEDAAGGPSGAAAQGAPVLEVQDLVKRYPEHTALDGVSFQVERGQLFGLLGPNGSGKTTTLSCALGLMRPTSGSSSVLGIPSRQFHRTQGRVAVVFDAPVLLRGHTLAANLAYVARLRGAASGGRGPEEALRLVGLEGLERRRASRLSLGQSRRLSIACALLGEPELLVLDEPLSGLDPVGVREMLALFARLRDEGITLVLSSHRLYEMERLLSHAAILIRGRLAAWGSLEELLGAHGRVRVETPNGASLRSAAAANGWRLEAEDEQRWTVAADGMEPAELNRRLVEAGVPVARLEPARQTLPGLFDALVQEQPREATR
ncbi:MAG: ABC transporter ATP-binding protein [Planctomycetes bacterium]|nr:ABC transporter ATP-binding protein [Planctomycetota bacterium]